MTMKAVALAADNSPVFSHVSAAAVWGLPILGAWPPEVHTLVASASGGRSGRGIRRHCVELDLVRSTVLDNLRVTSVERTLIDLARTLSFASAVMAFDHALATDRGRKSPMTTKSRILAELEHVGWSRGRNRVLTVVAFADGASGSPGESLSRVRIFELGFPAPCLQAEFVHHTGIRDFADFDWPDYEHLGEFDGHGKYLDPRMRAGLSPDQIVIAEKRREDRLRTRRAHFTRWEWGDALQPARLLAILVDAGLPRTGIRTFS